MSKKNRKKQLVRFVHGELNNASKTLLANIRFSSIDGRMKTIVVTSSGPDEGKTIVATNLANAIATSGKKVLIIDCDMRNRCLYKLLDIHVQHGIYSVLSGQASLERAISATSIDNLYFLDSEPGIPSPPDLLSTRRFEQMMSDLRERFDFVIIDTPPVSLFVDAAIVASIADGTLFVLRQRKTKRAAAVDALQQLNKANAHVLGTVLTFCAADEDNYYYAYYTADGRRVNKDKLAGETAFKPLRDVEAPRQAPAASAAPRRNGHERTRQADGRSPQGPQPQAQQTRQARQPESAAAQRRAQEGRAANPYAAGAFRTADQQRRGR